MVLATRVIARGGRQPAMAEQDLDDADVGARFQQMGGEAVAQGVHRDRLAQARPPAQPTRQAACSEAGSTGRSCSRPGKQPVRRPANRQ